MWRGNNNRGGGGSRGGSRGGYNNNNNNKRKSPGGFGDRGRGRGGGGRGGRRDDDDDDDLDERTKRRALTYQNFKDGDMDYQDDSDQQEIEDDDDEEDEYVPPQRDNKRLAMTYNNKNNQDGDDDDDEEEDNNQYEEEEYEKDDDEDEKDDEEDDEEEMIKRELGNVSFSTLLAMSKKKSDDKALGLDKQKHQHQPTLGQAVNDRYHNHNNNYNGKQQQQQQQQQKDLIKKPKNKDEPTEVTATKPVSRYRVVVKDNKPKVRDPRFSNIGGEYSERHYRQNYGFLDDVMKSSINQMKEKLNKTTDEYEASVLQREIQSTQSRLQSQLIKDKERETRRQWAEKEIELVKQGKKPFFQSQRGMKEIALKEKYHELKDSGRLDKFMEKRRKKVSSKDKVRIPTRRERSME